MQIYGLFKIMKVIGFKKSSGEYQGRSYSNYRIYLTGTISDGGFGYSCESVKVPVSVFDDFVKTYVPSGDLNKILGLDLDISYNKYGQVSKIYLNK